jgi:hypothetical protein
MAQPAQRLSVPCWAWLQVLSAFLLLLFLEVPAKDHVKVSLNGSSGFKSAEQSSDR